MEVAMPVVGKSILVAPSNWQQVRERLEACGAKYETVERGEVLEVRYEDSLRADHLLAPYLLPPRY